MTCCIVCWGIHDDLFVTYIFLNSIIFGTFILHLNLCWKRGGSWVRKSRTIMWMCVCVCVCAGSVMGCQVQVITADMFITEPASILSCVATESLDDIWSLHVLETLQLHWHLAIKLYCWLGLFSPFFYAYLFRVITSEVQCDVHICTFHDYVVQHL